jgi:hypothetical protein
MSARKGKARLRAICSPQRGEPCREPKRRSACQKTPLQGVLAALAALADPAKWFPLKGNQVPCRRRRQHFPWLHKTLRDLFPRSFQRAGLNLRACLAIYARDNEKRGLARFVPPEGRNLYARTRFPYRACMYVPARDS